MEKPRSVLEPWRRALADHWPEYLIEAACLGTFMVSACVFGTLFGHPDSPLAPFLPDAVVARLLMGAAMGLTAIALIYSRIGKRSGAHMNPATTLAFFRLGKIDSRDAVFYIAAQFTGAVTGVLVARAFVGPALADPTVRYVVTVPGSYGLAWAFAAEAAMTLVLMTGILYVSNSVRLNRYTGLVAGALVMTYIWFEAPVSGMSMNPARTLGSAVPAAEWSAIWIYFLAPPIGMLLAAELYVRRYTASAVLCAKLHHDNDERCIFRCNYPDRTPTKRNRRLRPEDVEMSERTTPCEVHSS